MKKRIGWIDTARGISMALILFFHTEMYYIGYDFIPYGLYVANVLMAFFFISGYLFYKENDNRRFSLKNKLRSIARGIIMPYFIFTTAMALPKAVAHNNFTSLSELAANIIMGRASWFVTALAVAEILFAFTVAASEKYKTRWILPLSAVITAVAAFNIDCEAILVWNTNIALMAVLYLYCGYIYHQNETKIASYIYGIRLLPILIAVILIKWYECSENMSMLVFPLDITSFPVFFIDTILSTLSIIGISKILPTTPLMTFTGRNSIVYYFLCGGVPLIVSAIMGRIGLAFSGNYAMNIVAFIAVYAIATAMTWFICRYLPFVTGRRGITSSPRSTTADNV